MGEAAAAGEGSGEGSADASRAVQPCDERVVCSSTYAGPLCTPDFFVVDRRTWLRTAHYTAHFAAALHLPPRTDHLDRLQVHVSLRGCDGRHRKVGG